MSEQSSQSSVHPEVAQALARVHARAQEALNRQGGLESLNVKELQLQALQQVENVMANDQKASIISVVVYVAVT